ncbi:uncharacterized protein LOC117141497 [Drosophila mauritiana]|uniref:Uncharacterized protein LOC117141497 n=1 Tax=Drosophila mauritiana TaxID=7226 RepID=A0A6P8JX30_DROMA|nr:uncharacterized protein LOC117141497 [Drosophila mauritiana]
MPSQPSWLFGNFQIDEAVLRKIYIFHFEQLHPKKMSLDYKSLVLNCLVNFFHSICFYALWQERDTIYQMEWSCEKILLVGSFAAALTMILALVFYYSWMIMVMIWRQYCVYLRRSKRMRFLFKKYRGQQVGELK